MNNCDIAKTEELARLCATDPEQRNQAWRLRFYDAVARAALVIPKRTPETGPDGFPYLLLDLPEPGTRFEGYSLVMVLPQLLRHGLGAAINAAKDPPDWVFSYGCLWSFKEFGNFEVKLARQESVRDERPARAPALEQVVVQTQTQVLVGQPSEMYLPAYARQAIRAFLSRFQQVPEPSVFLMSSPEDPSLQSLVVSVHPEDFESQETFAAVMQLLAWYVPPHYRLSAVSRTSPLASAFQPL